MQYRKVTVILLSLVFCSAIPSFAQNPEPWRADQLLEPADLANTINHPEHPQPLVISVGPAGPIKGSLETGEAREKQNLQKLKRLLSKEDRKKEIVIYCGCCPFKDCPNVRPAFRLLNEMHFVNHRLLNIPRNIRVDWIDKSYPVKQ